MKKILILTLAALSICLRAIAQESDTHWLIVPRLDVDTFVPVTEDGLDGMDWGSTALYGLLEGKIRQSKLYYSTQLHLLSSDPGPLYKNTFKSDEGVWMDWLFLAYRSTNWELRIGKDYPSLGTIELDAYDFENLFNISSSVYNSVIFSQWGGSATYTTDSGHNIFKVQAITSPFGSHPFTHGSELERSLYSGSFRWKGDYDGLTTINSINFYEYAPGKLINSLFLGLLAQLGGGWNTSVDYIGRGRDFIKNIFDEGSVIATFGYTPSSQTSISLKAGYEYSRKDGFWTVSKGSGSGFVQTNPAWQHAVLGKDCFFAGIQGWCRPFKSIPDLRLHASAVYNNYAESVCLTIGGMYYLDLYKYRHNNN